MHNWLFNEGHNTEENDAIQENTTLNDHNRIDDTHRRAIHGIAEDNSVEDKRRRREER